MPASLEYSLLPHPASPCTAVRHLNASATLTPTGSLALSYRLHSPPGSLLLPMLQPAGPGDDLWHHTCCEAFIAAVDEQSYLEFNFSPSSQWACYRFETYRERDTAFQPPGSPTILCQQQADGIQINARIPSELLPLAPAWQIGLSAVIVAADGSKSYWALEHSAARPDFHLRQSFTLTLTTLTP